MWSPTDTKPPETPSRRELLTLAGSSLLAVTAGCQGLDDDSNDSTTTPEPTGVEQPTAAIATATDTATESSTPTPETTPKSTVAEDLAEHVTPLDAVDPEAALDDLDFLADLLADIRVVGMGEATHGTREFFQMKDRLLRYMVTEMDLKVFAWEAYFGETLAIDEYIRTGTGNPKQALNSVFGFWNTESVLTMVEWLRSYNKGKSKQDKVRFYGFDNQSAIGSTERLSQYVNQVRPTFLDEYEDTLQMLESGGLRTDDQQRLETNLGMADSFVADMRAHLEANRSTYISETATREWELANQNLNIIKQRIQYAKASQKSYKQGSEARDRAMADNVKWLLEYEPTDQIALWAHNGHVRKTTVYGDVTSMGGHLAEMFGDAYYVIGQEFGKGRFRHGSGTHRVGEPPAGTLPAVMENADGPQSFLDINAAKGDEAVANWVNTPQQMHGFGASEPDGMGLHAVNLVDNYDALTYVSETMPTTFIRGQ